VTYPFAGDISKFFDELAVAVTYYDNGMNDANAVARTFKGIYEDEGFNVEHGHEGVEAERPFLTCADANCPDASNRDKLLVAGDSNYYQVMNRLPDGTGLTDLTLKRL